MKLTKNKCTLCCKPDIVQKYEFSNKQIENSFFSVNKKNFNEDLIKNILLCIICAYKIQISAIFKKTYDETCNRNNKFNQVKCFFCECKPDLIDIDENPNGIEEKINDFLDFVIIRHDYRHLKACLRCLYNLNIWLEVKNSLYKIMNIPVHTPVKKGSSRGQKTIITVANDNRNNVRRSIRKQIDKTEIWNAYLHKRLQDIKTVNNLMEEENFTINKETNTLNDQDKLFKAKPYVEIFLNSQISNNRKLRKVDIIEISDTEADPVVVKGKSKPAKLNLSLKKTDNTKRTPDPTIKRSLPRRNTKRRSKALVKRKTTQQQISNSLESSSESVVELSNTDDETDYMCNICDKSFNVKCDWLLHKLKHDKLQNLVINVSRKLPSELNVRELSAKQEEKKLVSSTENINRLLTKWVGENAAEDTVNTMESTEEAQEVDKSIESEEEENLNVVNEKKKDDENEEKKKDSHLEKDTANDNDCDTDHDKDSQNHSSDEENVETTKTDEAENDDKNTNEKNDETNEVGVEVTRTSSPTGKVNTSANDESREIFTDEEQIESTESSHDNIENDEPAKSSTEENETSMTDKSAGVTKETTIEEGTSDKEREDEDGNETTVLESENEDSHSKDKIVGSDCDTNIKSNNKSLDSNGEKAKDKVQGNKNIDYADDSSGSDSVVPPVMTCEDLLNILETNIEADDNSEVKNTPESAVQKRKREADSEEITPRRKKVRFAEKKEIFTPDKSGVLLERLVENDQFSQDEDDKNNDDDNEAL